MAAVLGWRFGERAGTYAAALAVTLAVYFVPYSWLYATPVYVAVGAVVALGTALLIGRESARGSTGPAICVLTGTTLLLGGVVALTS